MCKTVSLKNHNTKSDTLSNSKTLIQFAGKENVEPRVMPSRAAKNKTIVNEDIEDQLDEENEIQDLENNVGPVSTNIHPKKAVQVCAQTQVAELCSS